MLSHRKLVLKRISFKKGKHHDALSIYVDKLNDTEGRGLSKAEAYCEHVYEQAKALDPKSREHQESKEVYYTLLQIYLNSPYPKIRIDSSIKLLNDHSIEIGSCRSLELLPADLMNCQNLTPFFCTMLKRLTRNKHQNQIINNLMYALELEIHQNKIHYQAKKFTVTDEQICKECKKRMGKTAMVRFPNGDLIHYGCSSSSQANNR